MCSKCNKDSKIVNKFFDLCQDCNNIRLHGSKFGKQYNMISKPKKSRTDKPRRRRVKGRKSLFTDIIVVGGRRIGKMLRLDELFYEECFNQSNHKCEECNKELPKKFRGDDGKIIARWRYSHIIPKSIAPELRHVLLNINHLCLKHHNEWENGNKRKMKIWASNLLRFPNYLSRIENQE